MSKMQPLRRLLAISAGVLLGLVLLLVGSLTLALSTEAGSGWLVSRLIQQVNTSPDSQVTLAGTAGTLVSGLQLDQLEYRSDAARVAVDRVSISWNPFTLMSARLSVPEIRVGKLRVELSTPDSTTQSSHALN